MWYYSTQKGVILYDLESNNISISRDVTYYKETFLLKESINSPQTPKDQIAEDSEHEHVITDDNESTNQGEEGMNINLDDNQNDHPNISDISANQIKDVPDISEDTPPISSTDPTSKRYPRRQTRRSTKLNGISAHLLQAMRNQQVLHFQCMTT